MTFIQMWQLEKTLHCLDVNIRLENPTSYNSDLHFH